jgi:hypothetical protein
MRRTAGQSFPLVIEVSSTQIRRKGNLRQEKPSRDAVPKGRLHKEVQAHLYGELPSRTSQGSADKQPASERLSGAAMQSLVINYVSKIYSHQTVIFANVVYYY